MTFPVITVGLSTLLCVLYGMLWKTDKPVYLQMFRFGGRSSGRFAPGVVAGIVITLELGPQLGHLGREGEPDPRSAARARGRDRVLRRS